LIKGGREDPGDLGDADPAVAAVLTAFGAGQESEHAALMALANSRLLVPVVAVLAGEAGGEQEDGRREKDKRREKVSEMVLPTLIGKDGRRAVLAFTCQDALARWRPDARPVPVPASRVWLAARFEASAAVIDVAGPVPVVVDGVRLAALAAGKPVPLPQDDPDVHAAAQDAFAREPAITSARLAGPGAGGDIGVQVTLAAGAGPAQAGDAIQRAVASFVAATGGRFRRGVEVSVAGGGPAAGSR
jgi:hypothetical protein